MGYEKSFQTSYSITQCADQKKGRGRRGDHPSVACNAPSEIEKRCRKSNYAYTSYRGLCGLVREVVQRQTYITNLKLPSVMVTSGNSFFFASGSSVIQTTTTLPNDLVCIVSKKKRGGSRLAHLVPTLGQKKDANHPC